MLCDWLVLESQLLGSCCHDVGELHCETGIMHEAQFRAYQLHRRWRLSIAAFDNVLSSMRWTQAETAQACGAPSSVLEEFVPVQQYTAKTIRKRGQENYSALVSCIYYVRM
jgi:hypothetical protein